MVDMTALKGFANKRIKDGGPRGDGTLLPGEAFATDWLHAKELAAGGLASAKNAADLDQEPTEEVPAHHQLSMLTRSEINERRARKLDAATKPGAAKA